MTTESPSESADAVHHAVDPFLGQAVGVAIVVARDDFVFDRVVECFGVSRVGHLIIDVTASLSDGEPVDAVECLRPPAIENAAVETSIEDHFLAAGSAGLKGTPWVVQPDIDTLDQVSTNVDVVVFDECDAALESGIMPQIGN